MNIRPTRYRLGRQFQLSIVALATLGTVTFLGTACGGDDDNPSPLDYRTPSGQENSPNQSDQGNRTQIPNEPGADQGAGAGGGVPQGNATVPSTASPNATASTTLQPGRGPSNGNNGGGDAAAVSSDMSSGLQGHVYLAALLVDAIKDGDQGRVDIAKAGLNRNTDFIGQTVGILGGDINQFRSLWEHHLDLYEQYARAKAAGDDGKAADVRGQLESWAGDFANFARDLSPQAKASGQGGDVMSNHVDMTLQAIDATFANDPQAVQLTQTAALAMADYGKALAGVVSQ